MVPAAGQTGSSRPLVEALINPATVYAAPTDALADSALTPLQQRTTLLAWARDALSLETAAPPAPEDLAGSALPPLQPRATLPAWARAALSLETAAADALEDLDVPSRIDDVIDALAAVDPAAAAEYRRAIAFLRGDVAGRRRAPTA